jgi:hypothetical protein
MAAEGASRVVDRWRAIGPRHAAAALAVLAGVIAVWLSLDLFPYRSFNHDEGVYLGQAAMLLDGQLVLDPPVEGALRPWFFVAGDGVLYPKYAPVTAAIFAVGTAIGLPQVSLGLVAAVAVGFTYAVTAEVFDARVGLAAAALLFASPLFLIQSAVFLPYLPTFAILLVFAWAYLRAHHLDEHRLAAVAGAAAGLAFFSRPYTAVLFALPFVGHALPDIYRGDRRTLTRQLTTAAFGLVGVALALGYNWQVTGAPLTFPYQAFGPLDGPGFGRRVLLGHEVVYDLELAGQSTRIALDAFVTRWSAAAPLGVLLALGGLVIALRRGRATDPRQFVLAGLVPAVLAGQFAFWGSFNAIGTLDAPGFGLMGHLGPFYHLPLLLPTAAFGGLAVVRAAEWIRPRVIALDGHRALAVSLALLLALAGVAAVTVADPVAQNRVVTDYYEDAYEPIESAEFDRALVYLPTLYGNWLAHPFQYLRNEPGFGGDVVYAQDRRVFAVRDAFPGRTLYRYGYRGEWVPPSGDPVTPTLQRLTHVSSDRVTLSTTAGLPPATEAVAASLANRSGGRVTVPVETGSDSLELVTSVEPGGARVGGPSVASERSLPIAANDTLELTVFVDTGGLDSFEYEVELPVLVEDGNVRAMTPRKQLCRDVRQCGVGGTYVPGAHGSGLGLDTTLAAE